MANQLNFQYTAGVSLYALVYKPDFSQVYNSVTQLFESINPSNYADYALFLNEFSTLASESYYYASSEGAMSDTVNYPVVICIYPASGIATSGDTSVGTGVMGPEAGSVSISAGDIQDIADAVAAQIDVGDVTVTVTPVISMVQPAGQLVSQAIEIDQYATEAFTFTILDSDQNPIDDDGDSFKLVVYSMNTTTVVFSATGTAGGADGNTVVITVDDANTQTAGTYSYKLWNLTKDKVRAKNTFTIKAGAKGNATEPTP